MTQMSVDQDFMPRQVLVSIFLFATKVVSRRLHHWPLFFVQNLGLPRPGEGLSEIQLESPLFRLFGLNTTHQFAAARVFPHVDTAFVLFETEATNLPFAQLFRACQGQIFRRGQRLRKHATHILCLHFPQLIHAPQSQQENTPRKPVIFECNGDRRLIMSCRSFRPTPAQV